MVFIKWSWEITISKIEKLMFNGSYDEVLKIISNELQAIPLDNRIKIQLLIFESIAYLKTASLTQSEKASSKAITKSLIIKDSDLLFQAYGAKIEVLLKKFDLSEVADLIVQMSTRLKNEDTKSRYREIKFLHYKGALERAKGNYLKALENYHESINKSKGLAYVEANAITLNHIGITYDYLGDYKNSIASYRSSLKLFEELKFKSFIGGVLMNMGLALTQIGDFKSALPYYEKSLNISEETGDSLLSVGVTSNLGLINIDLGNLTQALEYFERCLHLYDGMESKKGVMRTYLNIGIVYNFQWKFDEALDSYQNAVIIAKEIRDPIHLARAIHSIAQTHRTKGDYGLALQCFKEVLEISKQIENPNTKGQILHELIATTVLANERDESQFYLDIFKDIIVGNEDNTRLNSLFLLSHASFLKSSGRAVDRVEAQKILYALLEIEDLDYEMLSECILKMCEILVKEYEWTKSEEIIKEIYSLTDRLVNLSSEMPSIRITVETLVLKSRTAFVLEDPGLAVQLLKEAEFIAKEEKLEYLSQRVSNEQLLLENNTLSMQQFSDKAAFILDLNKKLTDDYLDYINKKYKPFSKNI